MNPLLSSEEVLIFTPAYDSPGKKDATRAFHIGAKRFAKHYDLKGRIINKIDNSKSFHTRAELVLTAMRDVTVTRPHPTQVYVFFCHGWVSGIQLGFRSPTPGKRFTETDAYYWDEFCKLLSAHKGVFVLLYACSTGDDPDDDRATAPGSGDNSFGDLLRDELCRRKAYHCRVMAHFSEGHTWENPNIKLMDGVRSPDGGYGAMPVTKPGTEAWRRVHDLLKHDNAFPWEFPFMTLADIRRRLATTCA